ncbi:MAG: hypothetical protein KatS3mg105_4892 [Gemmatales bacterium]|nr:MAG: hypothetical protein KatS3mg105_4892 [Gemmatales bacterium]
MSRYRNRIVGHCRMRAGDLIPHEWNWRRHPRRQRQVLRDLLREVGLARSLLAYRRPDGKLQLIDGHLRRDLDPDLVVDVEILDVTEEEANKLLLSLDSLAALAETDSAAAEQLRQLTATQSQALDNLWRTLAQASASTADTRPNSSALHDQFFILVECRDEQHQAALLEKFHSDGLVCRALL